MNKHIWFMALAFGICGLVNGANVIPTKYPTLIGKSPSAEILGKLPKSLARATFELQELVVAPYKNVQTFGEIRAKELSNPRHPDELTYKLTFTEEKTPQGKLRRIVKSGYKAEQLQKVPADILIKLLGGK